MNDELLYICNTCWTVRFVQEHNMTSAGAYGYTSADALEIIIAMKGLCSEQMRRTLLHEIHHAIIDTVVNTFPDDEESLVVAMETGWYSIWRDDRNAWLMRLIRG